MKVVLVDNLLIEQNGTRVETVLQPHLGLISLLSVVRAAGHEGELYDPKLALFAGDLALRRGLYRLIARQLLAMEPDVVGFTSLGCNFICTLKVARQLRRMAPEIPILLGGPHATILDRAILGRYEEFDIILRHEAEHTLIEVLGALQGRELEHVPGITYRRDGQVVVNRGEPLIADLDQLPVPAYEAYPIERLALKWLRVEAGRGCPFACTFCSTASFFGRRYRLKSAARLCSELDALHERYGTTQFSLQHDLFTVDRDKVIEFCEEVAPRGYTWKCSARMDCVDRELLDMMGRAGCREMYFGVETGSPRLQHLAKKRLDLTLFGPTLDAAEAAGIRATVSLITGYPQEERADQAATLDLIGSCFFRARPPANVQLHMMTPEPGTELLEQFRDQLAFDGFISDFTFPTIERDDAEVIRDAPDVFMNNYFFVGALPRARHILVTELYYALYDLAPPLLSYLLDRFDGRLSNLVDAFEAWQAGHPNDERGPARDRLIAFCSARWGTEHHLTSLVRYMSTLAGMYRPTRRQTVPSQSKASESYELNPDARVLRDIHECPTLLDVLEAHHRRRISTPAASRPPTVPADTTLVPLRRKRGAASLRILEQQIAGSWVDLVPSFSPVPLLEVEDRLANYLVVPVTGTDDVRNLPLHEDLEGILDLFRRPRSRSDLSRLASLDRNDGGRLLEHLVELEVLVPRQPANVARQVALR